MKAKVREFDRVIKTIFLGNDTPKEIAYALYLHCLHNYSQVYLEECKYRIKKIQRSRFITAKLESDSEWDSESRSDTELMTKLESNFDSE